MVFAAHTATVITDLFAWRDGNLKENRQEILIQSERLLFLTDCFSISLSLQYPCDFSSHNSKWSTTRASITLHRPATIQIYILKLFIIVSAAALGTLLSGLLARTSVSADHMD